MKEQEVKKELSKFFSNLLRVEPNMLTTVSSMRWLVSTPPAPEAVPLRLIALVGRGQRGRHGRRGGLDGLLHRGALAILQH